jgi:hypothetical protein
VAINSPNGAHTPVSPEPNAPAIPTAPQTATTLTVDRVVANLQLLLAVRRSLRNEDLACWSTRSRAA